MTNICRLALPIFLFISTAAFGSDQRFLWSQEFTPTGVNFNQESLSPFYWGISWEGTAPKFENEDRLFSLGSVKKMITSATALRELGSDYQFTNEFTGDLDPAQGLVHSPAFSVSGDPTWGHPSYGESLSTRVNHVVAELKKLNIKKVIGEIQFNLLRPAVGQFQRPAEWKREWLLECYASLPTPVSLNGNCAVLSIKSTKIIGWIEPGVSTPIVNKLTSGKVNSISITPELDSLGRVQRYIVSGTFVSPVSRALPVHQNENWLRNIFVQKLSEAGISYLPKEASLKNQNSLTPLYVDLSSKPLKEILIPFLQESINLVGDRLHIEAPSDFITLASLIPDQTEYQNVTLLDGSGLIAANRITPKTFLHFLKSLKEQPYFQALYDGLPVSGVSGTLENRMNTPLLKDRVHAKTGTINGVANLAGYWTKSDQSLEPFVIFTESSLPASEARAKIDVQVADFARKN